MISHFFLFAFFKNGFLCETIDCDIQEVELDLVSVIKAVRLSLEDDVDGSLTHMQRRTR